MRQCQYVLLVLGFAVLVGCGGNGGGTAMMPPDQDSEQTPMPTTPPVDLAGLPAVMVPADTTIMAGDMLTIGDVTFSCPAGGADCALSQDDEGVITSTGGMATAALSDEAVARMEQEQMEQEARQAAMVKGLTAAITSTGNRPGGSTLNEDFELKPGGEIVWDGDSLEKDDMFGVEEFKKSNDALPSIPGWKGAIYTRTVENEMDALKVYSNAERAKSQPYMSYFADSNTIAANGANGRPAIVTDITDPAVSAASVLEDNGRFDGADNEGTLTLGTAVTTADAPFFDSRLFRKPATDDMQNFDGTTDNNMNEHRGTFAGIDGHYICGTDAGCSATYNAAGRLTDLTGAWTFRPTVAAARGRVTGVVKDTDYLTFGYWMQTVTAANGSMTYGINPFYAGADPYMWATVPTDLGKATYNGDAAGAYSKRAITDGRIGDPVEAGTFTADASLTANFQGSNVAPADQYSISGTVSNFTNDQGDIISDAWSLTLGKTHFGSGDDGDTVPDNDTAWTFGGGDTMGGGKTGTWEGAFYGNPASDATGTARQPGSVAGSFTGNMLDGHVIGAFGATKQ